MTHPRTAVLSLALAVVTVAAITAARTAWGDPPIGRGPAERASPDRARAAAAAVAAAGDPAAVAPATRQQVADAPRRAPAAATASGPRIFAGRVVQRDGGPLPPTGIFVAPPHRSLLSRSAQRRASREHELTPDGSFRFALPGDVYDDVAVVNIVGGHGDMTLLNAMVKIGEGAVLTVDGPADADAQPLAGTVLVRGAPVRNGDLLVLHQSTRQPISFQWNRDGNEIPVSLRVLKTRFRDVHGPVVLRLDDHAGLHAAAAFASIDELRDALEDGLELAPQTVTLAVSELAPGMPAVEVEVWSVDNPRFAKRSPVQDGVLRLRLTPGEYWLRGADPGAGLHGLARWTYRGDADTDAVEWGYVAPGRHSCQLSIRDARRRPIARAAVEARLVRPNDPAVQPRWFHVTADSGADGHADLAGLLSGTYRVRIRHRDFGTQELTVAIPQQQAATVQLQTTVAVALQIQLPAGAPPIDRFVAYVREANGERWTTHELGTGSASRDYVLHGLLPGSYEIVGAGGPFWGRCELVVAGDRPQDIARLSFCRAPAVAGTVLGVGGAPARGLAVELVADGSESAVSRAVTDRSGAFRMVSLAAGLGPETVVVKDSTARVLARGTARDGMEIRIDQP